MEKYQRTVYLKARRDVKVKKRNVELGDVFETECADSSSLAALKSLRIMRITKKGKSRHVLSILQAIGCIHEKFPDFDVRNLGERDIVITYEGEKRENRILQAIKAGFVSLIIFFGSAFSIMAFHNDISISKLFAQIYFWLTLSETDGFTVLEAAYSTGLCTGILIFFNRFGKKKFSSDPTPVQVRMKLYENDVQSAIIQEADGKGER